jgi:class 3 adenylate cyclase/pimeloyl-ACP methyl ester carboxylesterase
MEPRIQYAKTKDGVSIAFCTLGEGTPFVYMPGAPNSIQFEWQIPEMRNWCERQARRKMLVRYDVRGSGLSERNVRDFSLEAQVSDLETVTDRLGLERFALFGQMHFGQVAIAYAARHPERVSHLILWCTFARASDYRRSPRVQAISALKDTDWETYTEAISHFYFGRPGGRKAHRFAALLRESVTREGMQAFIAEARQFDVTSDLPQVASPTLVLHRRHLAMMDVDLARHLASQIPNARLALLDGESTPPYLGDTESVHQAIADFLGGPEEVAATVEPSTPGTFRTVLFTDVEGSTALTQRLGDAKARDVLRQHEVIVRQALKAHGGSELKTMGDGFMASFSSATRALESAIAMQRAFAAHNRSTEHPILVRVGLNAGEPIAEDEDLFGTAVIAAARIAAQARGGEILASDVVRQLVAGKQFRFASRGRTALKGLHEPVEVYEVLWQE